MVETLKPIEESKNNDNRAAMTESKARREILINSNNFAHINEGNIKSFYKIQSCIGRSKSNHYQKNKSYFNFY